MAVFEQLHTVLAEYWQLPHHQNATIQACFQSIQTWQCQRLQVTHEALFAHPEYQTLADYFVHELYANHNFDSIAKQVDVVLGKTQVLEKLIPQKVLTTGAMGLTALVDAIKLDVQLAEWFVNHYAEQIDNSQCDDSPSDQSIHSIEKLITHDNMLMAYREVNAQAQRHQQISNMRTISIETAKHTNSFMLQKGFALAKGTAYRHHLRELYDFMDKGFIAMRSIKNIKQFVEPFVSKEISIIKHVHHPDNDGTIDPFI